MTTTDADDRKEIALILALLANPMLGAQGITDDERAALRRAARLLDPGRFDAEARNNAG